MSKETNIEWASSTGSPWIGCTKISPGCKFCYAADMDANRFSKTMGGGTKAAPVSHWGKGAPRFRTKGFWKDALRWNKEAAIPMAVPSKTGLGHDSSPKPRPRIFPSLCDWLDDEVPVEWLADFLKLIHDTPNLDWLLLTKRPENWRSRLLATRKLFTDAAQAYWHDDWYSGNPPPNVWIGVSVEDQQRADERIPDLLKIPAKVRFLSVEPLLEPVDLTNLEADESLDVTFNALTGEGSWCKDKPVRRPIDWVIVGGESGRGARPCHLSWIHSVIKQCKVAAVPVFCKQLGSKPIYTNDFDVDEPVLIKDPKGGKMEEWPANFRVREFPK